MKTLNYPSDLTDAQWALLEPLLPVHTGSGRRRRLDMRRVVDAILYVVRTGCPWRYLPHDFPAWDAVYYYFRKWDADGTLATIHDELRKQTRQAAKPDTPVRTASVDSQSTQSAGATQEVGYDAGKKRHGRKRHIVVDSLGLILAILVTAASVRDAQGGVEVLKWINKRLALGIKEVYADGAYKPDIFRSQVRKLGQAKTVYIQRKRGTKGFELLPKRWVVERTFGWLTQHRRLCRSYEKTTTSETAMIRLAMTRVMLRRLKPGPVQSPFKYRPQS